jgi:hypothetical protein
MSVLINRFCYVPKSNRYPVDASVPPPRAVHRESRTGIWPKYRRESRTGIVFGMWMVFPSLRRESRRGIWPKYRLRPWLILPTGARSRIEVCRGSSLTTRWTIKVSFPQNSGEYATKFAPHKALTLIAFGQVDFRQKLTFDSLAERCGMRLDT